jgi:hypothetical protein
VNTRYCTNSVDIILRKRIRLEEVSSPTRIRNLIANQTQQVGTLTKLTILLIFQTVILYETEGIFMFSSQLQTQEHSSATGVIS